MKQINSTLREILFDPQRAKCREQITIKARLLFDYLKLPARGPAEFDRWMAELTGSRLHLPIPGDALVKLDEDGDVSLVQPYAEMFLLHSSQNFGAALGVILMIEGCYLCEKPSPEQMIPILSRYRPLAKPNGFAPLALLHEFLLIEDDLTDWYFQLTQLHGMLGQQPFSHALSNSTSKVTQSAQKEPLVSSMMAEQIAITHPGIRGRKVRACLTSPGVTSIELDRNCPALLELLLTKPEIGTFSPIEPDLTIAP